MPTTAPLGAHVMVVLCAERHGLVANLTRMVHLEAVDAATADRQHACDEALRAMREATVPGATLGDVFDVLGAAYRAAGVPEAWRDHHQGGIAGYRPREVVAVPGDRRPIEAGMAFAWNPSLPLAKAEETFVVTGGGPVVIAS